MTLLWDVRSEMEKNEAQMLESIISKNKLKSSYYIFKHSNWTNHDMNVMKSTYMLRSDKPPQMLGTVLWHVDNKKGTLKRVWDLPLDVMVDSDLLDPDNSLEHVVESAKQVAPAIVVS